MIKIRNKQIKSRRIKYYSANINFRISTHDFVRELSISFLTLYRAARKFTNERKESQVLRSRCEFEY